MYRDPFTEDDVREIRRMKARIERERIPPGEDPQFHLKLGRGSLSDVEFTVQLLQLVHGGDASRAAGARRRSTRSTACAHAGAARRRRRRRARGRVPVLRAGAQRALPPDRRARPTRCPSDGDEAEKLALLLGYVAPPAQRAAATTTAASPAAPARVVERVFYGLEPS